MFLLISYFICSVLFCETYYVSNKPREAVIYSEFITAKGVSSALRRAQQRPLAVINSL